MTLFHRLEGSRSGGGAAAVLTVIIVLGVVGTAVIIHFHGTICCRSDSCGKITTQTAATHCTRTVMMMLDMMMTTSSSMHMIAVTASCSLWQSIQYECPLYFDGNSQLFGVLLHKAFQKLLFLVRPATIIGTVDMRLEQDNFGDVTQAIAVAASAIIGTVAADKTKAFGGCSWGWLTRL